MASQVIPTIIGTVGPEIVVNALRTALGRQIVAATVPARASITTFRIGQAMILLGGHII
jgi:hypothetical protein